MGIPVSVHSAHKDYCIAQWDRVLIQVWRGPPSSAAVESLEVVCRSLLRQGPKACSLSVVEGTSPPPQDDARTALSRFYRTFAPDLAETIVVAEGSGFRGALVRGVGLTLSTLAPKTLPFRFLSNLDEAVGLISPHLSSVAGGSAGLAAAVEEVRGGILPGG